MYLHLMPVPKVFILSEAESTPDAPSSLQGSKSWREEPSFHRSEGFVPPVCHLWQPGLGLPSQNKHLTLAAHLPEGQNHLLVLLSPESSSAPETTVSLSETPLAFLISLLSTLPCPQIFTSLVGFGISFCTIFGGVQNMFLTLAIFFL